MPDYSKLFDTVRDLYALPSYYNKLGRAFMPLRYFFELTYLCNLNCPYCYIGNERKKDELTTQEWFNVIDQIPFYSFVTLVGGEPLIRKDFIPILEKTAKKTFGKLNVVTNGVLIDEEMINAFIKTKMMLLSVSLDGYGENHDKNRNKEGIFDKIITNLDNLRTKSTKPMVDIKTIVLENNLDDLPKLYKLCEDMKFDFLSISFLRNNDLKQNSVLRETFGQEFYAQKYPIKPYFNMEHFKSVYSEIEAMKGKTKVRFSPKFDGKDAIEKIEKFFSYNETKPIQEIYEPCMYPFSNMMINPQGDVYPCLALKIGNVREKRLKEVFNDPKFCCFRKNLKYSKVFEACQMCCELKVRSEK
ncbi:MAG: radical SAM protein [Candidatus Gastranaerophilales bacterium]|nr:radical SAM protein [Candidatus Gastranaerophilales bacterium]